MQYLRRFTSIAPLTRKNEFPTTDIKMRHFPIFSSTPEFPTIDFKMRYPPSFSSITVKFMTSPNRFYYGEEDKISEPSYEGEDKISEPSYEGEDRISELPQNILDCIFDRLPICDAARTSILSRKWRHIWSSYPQMVFDENFFKEISIRIKISLQSDFTKAIHKALSSHGGPILKFSLHIPNYDDLRPHQEIGPEIDEWMLFLSRNGIKELEIDNSNRTPYILPSCIFSCSLSDMKLRNCILKPPNEFNGFNQLVNLELVKVSMSTTLLQNTPLLKKFSVIRCNDIEDEFIYSRLFSICMNSGKVDWLWIGNEKQLKYVRIELGLEVKNDEQTVNMMKFLKNIPKVEELYLDGFSLKYLGTRSYPHKVDLIHSSITHIMVRDFGVDDLSQISSVLCLLKNCPSLMTLKLDIASSANNKDIEPVVEYLEQSNCMDVSLDILQTVSIKFMKDIKTELLLIKLLLARSTCLQRMIIQPTGGIGGGVWLRTSSEILRFPRAASSAQVIYE